MNFQKAEKPQSKPRTTSRATPEEQFKELKRGTVEILPEDELLKKRQGTLSSGSGETVQVKLGAQHSTAPGDLVNIYAKGVHPLEQVQQECLRSLRTGRPGI